MAKTQIFMAAIERAGKIAVKELCPYIYFIKRGQVLYIGETQRIPLSRWGEHFAKNGSFRKALEKVDEELYLNDLFTEIYVYRCVFIETNLKKLEHKQATQYIENQIHLKVFSSGATLRLISDTIRTTPINNKYNHLKTYAGDLYSFFMKDSNKGML